MIKGTNKNNTFIVNYGSGSDVEYKTSDGKDTLYIRGLMNPGNLDWVVEDNDVVITTLGTMNPDIIRLTNFFKLNGKHSVKYLQLDNNNIIKISDSGYINNYIKITNKSKIKNYKIMGSIFNDIIDASLYTKAGINYKGLTINGGAGFNTIIGTNGLKDTIIGGNNGNHITVKNGNKTVKTGSGNDYISICGDGIKKINAGNGNNKIYISGSSKSTIKTGKNDDVINVSDAYLSEINIYAGKGNNSINIDNLNSWGNITIKEERLLANNIISFSTEFKDNNLIISKSGDKLIFEDKYNKSTLIFEKYFTKNQKNTEYNFFINDIQKTIEDFANIKGGIRITGKGTLKGSDYADIIEIVGNKTTKIYTGKGDDKISSSEGNRVIYFYEGDGCDTVDEGDGIDTLVFKKGTTISAKMVKENLILNYGGIGDTVTLLNYNFKEDSRKYYYIGNKKYKLSNLKTIGEQIVIDTYQSRINGTYRADMIKDQRNDYKGKNFVEINSSEGGDSIDALSDYINAGSGDDYINANLSYIYGGKGDDNFVDSQRWYGSIYYFKSGDGNDILQSKSNNLFVFMDETNINNLEVLYSDGIFKIKYNNGYDSVTCKSISENIKPSQYGIQLGDKQYIYNNQGILTKTIDFNSLQETVLSWNNSYAKYEYFPEEESDTKSIYEVMLMFNNSQ